MRSVSYSECVRAKKNSGTHFGDPLTLKVPKETRECVSYSEKLEVENLVCPLDNVFFFFFLFLETSISLR